MYINNIPKISPKDIITIIIHLRINTHTITTLKHFFKTTNHNQTLIS